MRRRADANGTYDALVVNMQDALDREQGIYKVLRELAEMAKQLNAEMAELRDELVTQERRHRRDVDALRESIRATDRVLADRTSHLA